MTNDEDVVTIGNDILPEILLLRYLRNMKRVSIEDVSKRDFEIKKEAYTYMPLYRKFIKTKEKELGKKYEDFNIFEAGEVRQEFVTEYKKLKKQTKEEI